MIEYLMSAEALVYGALIFYVLGFLFRDELWLRGMLLIGTMFYVFYYYFAPSFPLWEAIATSAILGVVNIMMIGVVAMERSKFTMNSHTSFLYGHFPNLNPGQFRRLLKCGAFETADAPTVLCEEGRLLERLFFVVDGDVQITKDGRCVEIGPGHFIGELAFLAGGTASATVEVSEGTRYLVWSHGPLRALLAKSPNLSNAMLARFNLDLVGKLATSQPSGR